MTNLITAMVRPWLLRIDNRRQSAICAILAHSLAMPSRLLYHISEERLYFSLSKHIFHFMNSFTYNKLRFFKRFFTFIF